MSDERSEEFEIFISVLPNQKAVRKYKRKFEARMKLIVPMGYLASLLLILSILSSLIG
jgi:hypothetical protein